MTHDSRQPTRRAAGRLTVGLAAAACALSACGTTVPFQGTAAAPLGGTAATTAQGQLPVTAAGAASVTGPAGGPAGAVGPVGQTASLPGGSAPGAQGGGGAQGGTATAPGVQQVYSRGVTASTISVGVLYPAGFDKAAAALGLGGATTGDVKAETQAIINSINQAGGVAHRKLVPVWAEQQSISNADQTPGLCAQLTQDNKIFAVMSVLDMTSEWLACFRKANVPLLDDAAGVSRAELNGLSVVSAGEPYQERLYKGLIAAMVHRAFLAPSNKIGLLWLDTPDITHLVDATVRPALAAAGLNVASKFAAPDDSSQVSSYSNAVLQFRTAGVDRVLSVGTSPLFFMNDASSQNYHPGYVLSSEYGPGALLEVAAPKDQLANSVGTGWEPFTDIDSAQKRGPVSSNETRCLTIMRQSGQASTSTLTEALQVQMCDAFFVFQSALDSGVPLTVPGLVNGVLGLGTGYLSSATFRTSFVNRLDGPAASRDFSYFSSCSCFQYDRPLQPFA